LEIDKELIRGQIDLIVLAMLAAGDLYGYDLAKRVKAQTDGAYAIKEGTLYLVFKRLEAAGLVASYWGEGQVGARRKYYHLQPSGQAHLASLTEQWRLLSRVIETCLGQATAQSNQRPSPTKKEDHP